MINRKALVLALRGGSAEAYVNKVNETLRLTNEETNKKNFGDFDDEIRASFVKSSSLDGTGLSVVLEVKKTCIQVSPNITFLGAGGQFWSPRV